MYGTVIYTARVHEPVEVALVYPVGTERGNPSYPLPVRRYQSHYVPAKVPKLAPREEWSELAHDTLDLRANRQMPHGAADSVH